MECVFTGYCDNGRIKTSGVSVNNSSGASGWIKKKAISSNGIFWYIFFAFHYSVETPVREKVIKSERLIQPLCRMPVSLCRGWLKMEDSSGGQHICLWFDWDLIANFWLMSGKGFPKLSISTDVCLGRMASKSQFLVLSPTFTFSTVNKAIKTFWFLPLRWVLEEGLYGDRKKKWRNALTSRDKWGVVFNPPGHPSSHCSCQVSIFLRRADRAVFFCFMPEQMQGCELQVSIETGHGQQSR